MAKTKAKQFEFSVQSVKLFRFFFFDLYSGSINAKKLLYIVFDRCFMSDDSDDRDSLQKVLRLGLV